MTVSIYYGCPVRYSVLVVLEPVDVPLSVAPLSRWMSRCPPFVVLEPVDVPLSRSMDVRLIPLFLANRMAWIKLLWVSRCCFLPWMSGWFRFLLIPLFPIHGCPVIPRSTLFHRWMSLWMMLLGCPVWILLGCPVWILDVPFERLWMSRLKDTVERHCCVPLLLVVTVK